MFETFDHTADIGLRVRAATLGELLAEAGRGFFSLIAGGLDSIQTDQRIEFSIEGTEPEDLLLDWLRELLFTFETRRLLLARFDVQVEPSDVPGVGGESSFSGVSATAWGEPFDPARHELDLEIKAVTYHGLKVQREADGWLGEVVLDL